MMPIWRELPRQRVHTCVLTHASTARLAGVISSAYACVSTHEHMGDSRPGGARLPNAAYLQRAKYGGCMPAAVGPSRYSPWYAASCLRDPCPAGVWDAG